MAIKIGGKMRLNDIYSMKAEQFLPLLDNNSIKMIYIDPPYDTKSKQFEYNDDIENWSDFILNLLTLSKDKLKDDGVIFISIDDNRMIDLRVVGNAVFGSDNFLGMFITRQATKSNAKHINTIHEYVVVYAKNKKNCPSFEIKRVDMPIFGKVIIELSNKIKKEVDKSGLVSANELLKQEIKAYDNDELFSWLKNYNIVDEFGNICFAKDLSMPSKPSELNIPEINLCLPALKTRGWASKEKFIALYKENKLIFKDGRPYEKHLLIESKDNAMSILNFYSRQGKHDLQKLGLGEMFKTAKPVGLIKYFIKLCTKNDDIILDYFAGSGTTAQAVIECNLEDNHQRNFLLCQMPEPIKNNDFAIQTLSSFQYEPTIDNIAKLRLKSVKEKYNLNEQYVKIEKKFHQPTLF